jgi:hypothetical protein
MELWFGEAERGGVVAGRIRAAYRMWSTLRLRAGQQIEAPHCGQLQIVSARFVEPAELSRNDAADAGYDSVAALVAQLRREGLRLPGDPPLSNPGFATNESDPGLGSTPGFPSSKTPRLVRIDFRFLGEATASPVAGDVAGAAQLAQIQKVAEAVLGIDARVEKPWAVAALNDLRPNHPLDSEVLAAKLGLSHTALKSRLWHYESKGIATRDGNLYHLTPFGAEVRAQVLARAAVTVGATGAAAAAKDDVPVAAPVRPRTR